MKREHWPEVGWRRRWVWAEAWAARRRSGCDVGLWLQGWKMGQRLASTELVKDVGGPAAVRQRGESWRRGTATAGASDGDAGGWGWRRQRRRLWLWCWVEMRAWWEMRADERDRRDDELDERWESLMRWWKKRNRLQRLWGARQVLGIKEWIKELDMHYFNRRIE